MSNYLPLEIMFLIFINFPSKTLVRFLSVSKSCYDLITSKAFVSSHLNRNPNKGNDTYFLLKLLNFDTKFEEFSFYLDDQKIENDGSGDSLGVPSSIMYPPLDGQLGFNRIVGISNGLICVVDDFISYTNRNPFLWNPTIDIFVELPSPGITRENDDMHVLEFWFDSIYNDFKVARIVYRWNGKQDAHYYDLPPLGEVYSLNTGEWRRINVNDVKCYMPAYSSSSHVYLNGRSHWIGYKYEPLCNLIMSYDMDAEVVREILLPTGLGPATIFNLKITEMMECLAIITDGGVGEVCRIWVMNEYGVLDSWTSLWDIPIDNGASHYRFLGSWKNGDVLMRDDHDKQLAQYAPESKSMVKLDINGNGFALYAGKYEESLALLDYYEISDEWIDENEAT